MLAIDEHSAAQDGSGAAGAKCSARRAMSTEAPERGEHARRLARNTAFFSFATGLSRVLGLVREVVAASYFGVTGAMSAFTIAFQVPNLVRALFADSALRARSSRSSRSCSRRASDGRRSAWPPRCSS